MVTGFARAFKVSYPDGPTLDGVQFPSGRYVVDNPKRGFVRGAVSFEELELPPGYELEWADGGGQAGGGPP